MQNASSGESAQSLGISLPSSLPSDQTGLALLTQIWPLHVGELRVWMRHRLVHAADVEDMLQDLFLKAMRQGARFREIHNARAWLFEVARNALVDRLRIAREQIELPEDLVIVHPETSPVDKLADCLPRALSELAADDCEAITLCDLQGVTQDVFAKMKGLSLPAAKSRVQRARKRLRAHLTQACQVRFDALGDVCCFVPRAPRD